MLLDIGPESLAPKFDAEAVDFETLLELEDRELEELLSGLGLKLGERARLKSRIKLARTGGDLDPAGELPEPAAEPAAAEQQLSGLSELASDEARLADITFHDFIAKGASGSVYRAVWQGMRCAVKRFSPGCGHDPELIAAFNKEVKRPAIRYDSHNFVLPSRLFSTDRRSLVFRCSC